MVERGLWWDLERVYRQAALVTAPTSYAAALTEARARLDGVIAISCGIDLKAFAPAGRAPAFRAAYGIPERPPLLHVGRLDPDKHVDQLISALALVRAEIDAQLVVVGRGKELELLRRFARSRGLEPHVHFCGFVADHDIPGAYEVGGDEHRADARVQSRQGMQCNVRYTRAAPAPGFAVGVTARIADHDHGGRGAVCARGPVRLVSRSRRLRPRTKRRTR